MLRKKAIFVKCAVKELNLDIELLFIRDRKMVPS